jgi:pimeloyl-ACP methyl ester carboxylesterase
MTPHDYLELPFRELPVSGGRIRYRRAGTGTPVLFVHGVFVNSDLWRGVVPHLVDDFDCIALDLPLGSHGLPMGSGADLSPDGLVAILVEVVEALGLAPVRIVANDSGGALTQVLTSRHPHLVHSILLTSCDAYDYFFPPLFRTLPVAARVPGALRVLSQALRVPGVRRLPIAYGWVTRRPMPSQTEESYLRPMRESAAVRRDLSKVLRDVRSSYTLTAAEKLRSYPGRVLLVWGEFDKVFPLRHARQLAQDLPHADLVTLPDTGAFVPEDAPDDLARLIRGFFRDSDATPTD